jgi:hypothetical protein
VEDQTKSTDDKSKRADKDVKGEYCDADTSTETRAKDHSVVAGPDPSSSGYSRFVKFIRIWLQLVLVEIPKLEVESSVKTPAKPTNSVRESRSKTVKSTDKKRHHSKSNSSKHSSSKKEHKRSKKRSSRDKRLDKLADKLSINHIVGDGKSKDQAEAELLKRMLDRNRRKHRSSERLEKRRKEQSKSREESKPSASRVDDTELIENPVPSQLEPPPTFYPTQSVPSTSFSTMTPFAAQDAPIQHPIMNIPSYK